ncbi:MULTISPECIES: hypothetical protein [Xanthomonas]|uniref:hypothetical protein n=1 Tax=Xanthomonas TaxID=338 RepID=UPI0003A079F4|nr:MULTISPECIES: hypothetical protein [Xanthomonas]MCW0458794.1 hypothetical protein [Xanthomonas sacchari]
MISRSIPAAQSTRPASTTWMRVLPWLALLASGAFCIHYYLELKKGFFDDVYIYLAVARNAMDYGTWQYYPHLAERGALLASSPIRIVVLTAAAALSELFGHGQRTLLDAKITILLSGMITWLVFLPFWRRNLTAFAWLGATLALLSTCLDTIFEFEGGLLLMWVATLAMLVRQQPTNLRLLSWLLPLGPLIRPDVSLPILALYFVHIGTRNRKAQLLPQIKSILMPLVVFSIAWVTLCALLRVWPVPVTYWGKSALPFLFEKTTLLVALPERLGISLLLRSQFPSNVNTIAGWACILGTLGALALNKPRINRVAIAAMVLCYVIIFFRMPANFWWYYQNILSLIIGALLGRSFFTQRKDSQNMIAGALGVLLITSLCYGRLPNDGPNQWRTGEQTRAQGYLSLAVSRTDHGTFKLPETGEFILRNPEIGMISYYSTLPIFQWDSAGLAQPLDNPLVTQSHMRYFYPTKLRRTALEDAQDIVNRVGHPIPVLDVWAMEDRDYSKARTKCHWVLPKQALCINQYRVLEPAKGREAK